MAKEDNIEMQGTVLDKLLNTVFPRRVRKRSRGYCTHLR